MKLCQDVEFWTQEEKIIHKTNLLINNWKNNEVNCHIILKILYWNPIKCWMNEYWIGISWTGYDIIG